MMEPTVAIVGFGDAFEIDSVAQFLANLRVFLI